MTNETNKLEILVIEDEHIGTAKKHFDSVKTLNVDYAETKEEALSKLAKKEYCGVLTDASFPYAKGEEADYNGKDIILEAMKKETPWVEYSSHGASAQLTFPIRKIDSDEVKQFESYSAWERSKAPKDDSLKKEKMNSLRNAMFAAVHAALAAKPQHRVSGYNGACHDGDPKDSQKIIGHIESYLPTHQKTTEEGWKNAYSILQNVIEMYKSNGDLAGYFMEKAKETKEME